MILSSMFVIFFVTLTGFISTSQGNVIHPLSDPMGVISPIKCTSQGDIKEFRLSGCDSMPCNIMWKKTYRIEVDLDPSVNHNQLDLKITAIKEGTETTLHNLTLPVAVRHGTPTTILYPWTVLEPLPAGDFGMKISLSADGQMEFCGIIPSNLS